jgi:ATP-dependent RNA helicase DDX51/DBP6
MDIKGIKHVINYDSPPTARGYVHRAGRTARAGKEGDAWTLVSQKVSRWFWKSVIGGIKRTTPVERVKPGEIPELMRDTYHTIIEVQQ